MTNLLKLSFLNVKNIVRSKAFIALTIGAVMYSLVFFIAGNSRLLRLQTYSIEFGRFLYVAILYGSVSIIRKDIVSNTTKTIFTGIFNRVEIMLSKLISLIFLGLIFYIMVECDALLIGLLDYKKMGINQFIKMPHFQTMLVYIVLTFSVGAFMFLINSIIFKKGKNILFSILILSAINFNNAIVVTLAYRNSAFAEKISLYAKTPFYIWTDLFLGLSNQNVNIAQILISILYGLLFFVCSTFIINKREI
ncbi:ABC transporter permease [Clostridium botulinum]|uniref:ABC transporter permease n=1 Tax=Clostridium botulinum TaxID=1491 RepID=UPI0006A54F49|nr:ABC transporter permease [Clostridium botulinum]KOC32728.1 hypothetical protein ADU81_10850 [Clostridium botulinum]